MKNKKPTMMEVKNAINNLIQDIVSLDQKITAIDRILNMYVSFFNKFFPNRVIKI